MLWVGIELRLSCPWKGKGDDSSKLTIDVTKEMRKGKQETSLVWTRSKMCYSWPDGDVILHIHMHHVYLNDPVL